LLIVFFLVQQGHLPEPLLYISSFLEQHRRDYYERLQAVRERGEIQEWLQFFLTAVARQANDAVERAELLSDIRERYRRGLSSSRSRASEVVDLLLENPVVSIGRVTGALGITPPGARNLVRQLEEQGWLMSGRGSGRGTKHYWIAHEIMNALQAGQPELHERPAPEQVTGSDE
jgi:Fic family protein